jgi:hypothetical protein
MGVYAYCNEEVTSSGTSTGGVLYLASIAPWTSTYSGGKLTSLAYSDFENITSHTKTFTYTGSNLTSTQEIFTYDGDTWTLDHTYTYSGSRITDKTTSLVII